MQRTPSVFLLQSILFNDENAKKFLLENKVFYTSLVCPGCDSIMQNNTERWTFRCPAKRCRKEFSMMKHTFFYGSKLGPSKILYLAHLWLNCVRTTSAMGLTGHNSETVAAFYDHFRKLAADMLNADDQIIGGNGIVVEIDETKLGISF